LAISLAHGTHLKTRIKSGFLYIKLATNIVDLSKLKCYNNPM